MVKGQEPTSEDKKNIIANLLHEYGIKFSEDIQDAFVNASESLYHIQVKCCATIIPVKFVSVK